MTEPTWAEKMAQLVQISTDAQIAQLQAQIDEIKAKLNQITPTEEA